MKHTLSNRRDFVKTAGSALGLMPLAALANIPTQELDRELDDTFPASDPLPWSHEVK